MSKTAFVRLIATLSALLLGVAHAGEAPRPGSADITQASGPRLTVSEPSHDFGTVRQGRTQRHLFTLANAGTERLEITDIQSSCGCTTVGDWPKTLKPGESAALPVELDTAQFLGPVAKAITIVSNDPAQETVLELKANIWTPITVSNPTLIIPPGSDPTTAATRTATVRNETETPLKLGAPESDSPRFKAGLREIEPGRLFEVIVTTVPPLTEGTHSGTLTVTTSNKEMPVISIRAIATVLPAVQVAPAEFLLPSTKLDLPEKRFAVVLSNRAFGLEVTDVTTNAPGVTVTTLMAENGRQFTATLSFPAGFTFPENTTLWLRGRTNHPSLPTFEIPIRAVSRR